MTDQATQCEQDPSGPQPIVVVHPRDPGTFNGTSGVDVDDWLALYERVSSSNHWDPTLMLANILFYLRGTAKLWYETHEEELTSWDVCKQKLRDLFGKPIGRQAAARKELATRVQTSTEPYIAYIQDVLALCRKIDKDMPEEDKVGHILKGIADDAFNFLLCKDCSTVESVIAECRRFEQAKSRRIIHRFDRFPNTAATSSCEDLPTLHQPAAPENVTRIVRRELEAMAPVPVMSNDNTTGSNLATVSLIQAVVRQEIANMGISPNLQSANATPNSASPVVAAATPTLPSAPRRNPAEWRTLDDRPICFTCHRIGHIARHCRSRWISSPRPSFYNWGSRSERVPYAPSFRAETSAERFSEHRTSRSPSPQRRQSRSPQPRRSRSPFDRHSGN